MTRQERRILVHLAADWDAQAAQLERRTRSISGMDWMRAKEKRQCAADLRRRLAELHAGASTGGSS